MSYLKESCYTYFLAISQPTRFLDWLKFDIPIYGERPHSEIKENFWQESSLWAWCFYILGVALETFFLLLVVRFFIESQGEQRSFDFLLLSDADFITSIEWGFLIAAIRILLFPLSLFLNNTVRAFSIRFISGWTDDKKISSKQVWELVGLGNTAYIFYCVPLLGKFIQSWGEIVLYYRALRWSMKWGKVKTLITIFLPSIFLLTLVLVLTIFIAAASLF